MPVAACALMSVVVTQMCGTVLFGPVLGPLRLCEVLSSLRATREGEYVKLLHDEEELVDLDLELGGPKAPDMDLLALWFPATFEVWFERSEDAGFKLGIDVKAVGNALQVEALPGGGLIEAWNRMHPEDEVCIGDWLLEANGKTGRGGIVRMCSKRLPGPMKLKFRREEAKDQSDALTSAPEDSGVCADGPLELTASQKPELLYHQSAAAKAGRRRPGPAS